MSKSLVIDIKGNSLDDGNGIRTVIFLKGCPLSCIWCHNPESKNANVELSFDSDLCVNCGKCREVCKCNALDISNPIYIDRQKCNKCYKCIDVCNTGALSLVGRNYTNKEILDIVLKDKPFFDSSGGGVTISGGEPTLDMEYLSILVKMLKEDGINVLIETCGYFNYDKFVKLILPYIDSIFFDIKIFDKKQHIKYCGVDNKLILDNFTKLNKLLENNPNKILPRTPLIPNITATEKNIKDIVNFLDNLNVKESQVLPYNPLWIKKNKKIGIKGHQLGELGEKFMTNKEINKYKQIYFDAGIKLR